MRKLIYSAALFAATMIGFTSCDKDDEANLKDGAVGDCTVTMSFWMYDGAQLSAYTKRENDVAPGEIVSTSEGLQMKSDGDVISLINITESSNGFTCAVKDLLVNDKDEETGETHTYTVTGFNGYEMKYHGGFNSSTKTLEFYLDWPLDKESLGYLALNLPENADKLAEIAPLLSADEDAATAKIEELGAKYKYIIKYSCVKK